MNKKILKEPYPSNRGGFITKQLFILLAFLSWQNFISAQTRLSPTIEKIAINMPSNPYISGEVNPCPNVSYTYSIQGVPTQSGYNGPYYSWNTPVNGNGGNAITPTTNITWSDQATSGSVSATVTFTKSDASDIVYNMSLSVTIKSLLIGQLHGPSAVQCGDTSPHSFYVDAVPNATSYDWTYPAGWSITAGTCQHCNQVSLNAPGSCKSGWVCVVAKNDCGQSKPSCIYVTNENQLPQFVNPITNICTSTTHDYPFSINPVPGALSYSWQITGAGASFPGNPTGTSASLHTDANVNGSITICVIAYFPYNKTTSQCTNVNLTNVTPSKPTFAAGAYLECVFYDNLWISVNNTPSGYSTSYTWTWTGPIRGIKLIGTGYTANVIANTVGQYNVYTKATNACGTSPISIYYPVDVINCSRTITSAGALKQEEPTDQKEISFFPNPASNSVSLIIPDAGNAQVKIMSLDGKLVKQFETHDQQTNLDVSDIVPGLYIININSGVENINKKIQIIR
jgi:hypothetical protein